MWLFVCCAIETAGLQERMHPSVELCSLQQLQLRKVSTWFAAAEATETTKSEVNNAREEEKK
jgi:hypothetical protein